MNMSSQYVDLFAGCDTPEPNRSVVTSGHKPVAVRTERNPPNFTGVAFESLDLRAACGVPQPDRLVTARRCEKLPVRTERHRVDACQMPVESERVHPRIDFPDFYHAVQKPGRQRPAGWSKGHSPNVVVEIDSMLAVKEIPDVSKMLLHPRERLEKLEAPAISLHVGHLLFDGSQSRFHLLFGRSTDHKPVADRHALFDLGKLFDDRLHQPAQ